MDDPGQPVQGCASGHSCDRRISVHGQLYSGLRFSYRKPTCIRLVVPSTTICPHQPSGTTCCVVGAPSLFQLSGTNQCYHHVRQYVYLRNHGDTRSQQVCRWVEADQITIPGHLIVKGDSLSHKGQIIKNKWSLNQVMADKIFHHWGSPHVDLFALTVNTKLATFMSPSPETAAWKVDSLVQSWGF